MSDLPKASISSSNGACENRCISVVMPVWRQESGLAAFIKNVAGSPNVCEVVVAAVEAGTGWLSEAESAGARCVVARRPSRGRQLNLGARDACGEWLLFQHADTDLEQDHLGSLAALTPQKEIVGGAFYRKFDSRHPRCRWLEPVERWHNRTCGALYGDQSLFVRREHFKKMGGFADIPLMEDVEFSKRLRRSGRIALLDPPITSSPRKHLNCGPWRTTFQNASLLALYKLGVSPARLHTWYYENNLTNHENHPSTSPHRSPAAADAPR